jgi:hypothetical protein
LSKNLTDISLDSFCKMLVVGFNFHLFLLHQPLCDASLLQFWMSYREHVNLFL